MYELFETKEKSFKIENDSNVNYNVVDEEKNVAINFVVDPTDNRIIITCNFEKLSKNDINSAIKVLTLYLDENFGAKQFIVSDSQYLEYFKEAGFTVPKSNKISERVRTTSIKNFLNIKADEFPKNFNFIHEVNSFEIVKSEDIQKLMETSGFLKSKIEQYELQGEDGFNLMLAYSIPFGIVDQEGKIVAFCRLTETNDNLYYLSDTFVDENVFGGKPKGTAILYKEMAKVVENKSAKILVIAPPDRVKEFDDNYACTSPDTILTKFSVPQKALNKIFEKEVEKLSEKKLLKKKN